ncbi:MAG: AEC family transporter [Planctomycetes bacterium]|nr:AEC family transporter [Planctomycetota bacterium]
MTSEIILAIVEIFGIFTIGWLARHKVYIREAELDRWSRFVIDFIFPFLVFNSIVMNFEAERLGELWPLPLLGFGMIAFGALAGFFLRRGVSNQSPATVKTFHHFCAINNYGFIPIIIIYNLWGEAALARLFFFNLGSSIGYWTIGVTLLGESDLRRTAKNMLSPSLLALFLALVLSITGYNQAIPGVVLKICGTIGAAAIPLILILVGASIYPFPSMQNKRDLAYLTGVRLVLLPLLMIGILLLLPLTNDVRAIALIVALMPASVSSSILTRRYGGDPDYASGAAVITTFFAIITLPLGLWLLQGFLPAP